MTDRPAQSARVCPPWCGTLTVSHSEDTEHGPDWVTSGDRPMTQRCWCKAACCYAGRPLNPPPSAPPERPGEVNPSAPMVTDVEEYDELCERAAEDAQAAPAVRLRARVRAMEVQS